MSEHKVSTRQVEQSHASTPASDLPESVGDNSAAAPSADRRLAVLRALSPRNISAIYVGIAIFVLFSLWIPDLFLTSTTLKTLLNNNAIAVLAALALVLPLSAGVINLAVGSQLGASSIFVAWLLIHQGYGIGVSVVLALLLGVLIGLATGLLVVYARIESFIATLGVSSLLAAFITGISGGQQILGMPSSFADFGTSIFLGLTYPVWGMLVVAVVLWYYLERTPSGRRIYAVGGNIEAARLSGVRVNRVIVVTLVVGGLIAALAGVLLTARLANADPSIGPGYLLPAFTAAFLGSTQFGGRFNVWGTVVALYVLAAGVKGLQLAGAPVWIPDAFNGASLLIAVALAKYQGAAAQSRLAPLARLLSRSKRGETPADPAG